MQKVLLVGYGYVGAKILSAISTEMDVTVVDRDRNKIKELKETPNIHPIHGDIINKEFISKLLKKEFDFVLGLTDSDKTNMLLSTMSKKNGAKFTIALIYQKESVEQLTFLKENLGIDRFYNMPYEMSTEVQRIVKGNLAYQSDTFGKGKIEVAGHSIEMDRNFAGQKVKEIGELKTLLVVGIARDQEIIVPNGNTVIQDGDYLYLMGLTKDLMNFKYKHFTIEPRVNKKLLLVGINEFTLQIAETFKDFDITIVDDNQKLISENRNKYSNVYFQSAKLKGGTFFNTYKSYDCTIISTEDDELNIVLGMMATKLSLKQVMIKVSDLSYYPILDRLNFTSILNPRDVLANQIIKKLKSDRGVSIYMAFNNKAEVSEFKLTPDSKLIGKQIMDIDIPEGMLVGGIVRRDGTAVIPRGKTMIEADDSLVIFCKNDSREKLKVFLNVAGEKNIFKNLIFGG